MQETPTIKIAPSGSRLSLDLGDLWSYRELLFSHLARCQSALQTNGNRRFVGDFAAGFDDRDFHRYLQSICLLRFIRNSLPAFRPERFAALAVHQRFDQRGEQQLGQQFKSSDENLFPRLIVPLAATLSGLIDLALGFVLLVCLMIFYGAAFNWQIVFAPIFIVLAITLALSLGTLFSALNVRFRDVKFALPFALQIWMFVSPVFYPASVLSGKWRVVFALNPLTGILEGFRAALFGTQFDWFAVGVSIVLTFILALASLLVFKRMEDDFADLI